MPIIPGVGAEVAGQCVFCPGKARTAGLGGREEERNGHGVQTWSDGSRYEGEFLNDLKHGTGIFTWPNGESYEGSFYKDYRHGKGTYSWPGGHKFVGKFYLNKKEGYGLQVSPNGSTFQGLYHADARFGPGVVTYPDGRQDVGLWHRERLLRLCTVLEGGFTLRDFPEHSAPRTDPQSQTQSQGPASMTAEGGCEGRALQPRAQDPLLPPSRPLPSRPLPSRPLPLPWDERLVLPPEIHRYSTDADHLPLPAGLRRELDRSFFRGQSEGPDLGSTGQSEGPDLGPTGQSEGPDLGPTGQSEGPDLDLDLGSTDATAAAALPLQQRMQAHIHKHRFQAEGLDWDVPAVVQSQSRDGFGPRGPLELGSERLIREASLGDRQSVYRILRDGRVHPDVGDARGHTALIAATVGVHDEVIHLLLDSGADVNRLTLEGVSPLTACFLLYYPPGALHRTVAERAPPRATPRAQVKKRSMSVSYPTEDRAPADGTSEPGPPRTSPAPADQENQPDDQQPHDGEAADQEEEAAGPGRGHGGGRVYGGQSEEDQDGQDHLDHQDHQNRQDHQESEERQERQDHQNQENHQERQERQENLDPGDREEEEQEEEEEDREQRETGEKEEQERSEEECSLQVLDGHIPVGTVAWRDDGDGGGASQDVTFDPAFDSARSLAALRIRVSEDVMQRTAEALSLRTGPLVPPTAATAGDPQETVRKMALMKTEHRSRWATMQLLLDRGADPNASRVPMPVLFLAIKAAPVQAVRRLLECGARTDVPLPPERKGLYPLHIAAALPGEAGPRITELLLHAVADPDVRALDQREVYQLDMNTVEPQAGYGNKSATSSGPPAQFYPPSSREPPAEGGRTPLHVACQRDSDYSNARDVVSLLLSHHAKTHLLWSGHSPLSLAIASGNDLALEELLAGGADPNLVLTRRVGSALCALTNISYDCGAQPRSRARMLDRLMKAGADILMPVVVGEGRRQAMGTAVDYAHYAFHQDWRVAHTPYHALNQREREAYNHRRQLLGLLGDLLREAVLSRERRGVEEQDSSGSGSSAAQGKAGRVTLPDEQPSADSLQLRQGKQEVRVQSNRRPVFRFCYQCGRSVGVVLVACGRCHDVFYCSKTCKMRAWNERHKDECVRAAGVSFSDSAVNQESRGRRESQAASRRLSMKKSPTVSLIEQMKVHLKLERIKEKLSRGARPGKARPPQSGVGGATRPGAQRGGAKAKDRPLSLAQKVTETHADMKENYSFQ